MTLARWPNEGFVRIVDVVGGRTHRIRGRPGDKIGRFIYDGDRPKRWVGEKDVWLHGYWFWDWADQRQQVESIDTAEAHHRARAALPRLRLSQGPVVLRAEPAAGAGRAGRMVSGPRAGHALLLAARAAGPGQGAGLRAALAGARMKRRLARDAARADPGGLPGNGRRRSAAAADVQIVGCTIRNAGSWAVRISGAQQRRGRAATSTRRATAASRSTAATARRSPRPTLGRQQPHPPLQPLESHLPARRSRWTASATGPRTT